MTKHKELFCFLLILTFLMGLQLPLAAQDMEVIQTYRNLQTRVHLQIVYLRLGELIEAKEKSMPAEKQDKLRAARRLVLDAINKYDDYSPSPIKLNYPELRKSPLSLQEHMYLALDGAQQLSTQIMVADVQYTESEYKQIQLLEKSIEFMKKALDTIEDALGWTYRENRQYWISILVPKEYKPNLHYRSYYAIDLLKVKADNSPEKVVTVRVMDLEEEITAESYTAEKLEKAREKFGGITRVMKGKTRKTSKGFISSNISLIPTKDNRAGWCGDCREYYFCC